MDFGRHEFDRIELDMKETGFNLRETREKLRIRIEDVAHYLGTSEQSIYNWEIGKSNISLMHLICICALYKTSIEEIIRVKTVRVVYCDYEY